MTEDDETMQRYGITSETNKTFHFQGHKYQRLEDAVNYAKKQQQDPAAEPEAPKSQS